MRLDHITQARSGQRVSCAPAEKIGYSTITDLICGYPAARLMSSIELSGLQASLPGDHRELEPPDPIPNSAVKWFIADGSVGFPHVRVGHRQVFILNALSFLVRAFFYDLYI